MITFHNLRSDTQYVFILYIHSFSVVSYSIFAKCSNILYSNIHIFNIQYWVADIERCKTFLKYSFIDLEQSDNNSSEWPDLCKQWVNTYSNVDFKSLFHVRIKHLQVTIASRPSFKARLWNLALKPGLETWF